MAEYVISQLGNDSTGTGSELNSWKTVGRAVSVAGPGDTIIVRGTLTGTDQISISSTYLASSYLTIRPHATDGGMIDGQWIYPVTGSGYVSGPDGDGHWKPLVELNGRYIKWQVPVTRSKGRNIGGAGRNITIQNYFAGQYLNVTWARNAGVNFNTGQDITCIGVNVEFSGSFYQSIRNPATTNWPVAFNFVRTPNVYIYNCRSYGNWGEGFSAGRGSNNVQVIRSIFMNNMSVVAYVNRSNNVLFDGCLIGHDGTADGFDQSSGLALRNEKNPGSTPPLSDITIVNCWFRGAKNNLLIANNQEVGDTIERVYIYHNTFAAATSTDNTHYNIRLRSGDRSQIYIQRNGIYQPDGRLAQADNYAAGEYFIDYNAWVGGTPPSNVTGAHDLGGFVMESPGAAWVAANASFATTFLDNYRPTIDYPMGTTPIVLGHDIEDTTRTTFCLGAIEFGTPVTPPPPASIGSVATVVKDVANTSTGNQTFTYSLDSAPTLALIFVGQATADDTATDEMIASIGACSSSAERAIAFYAEHNNTTTNSGRKAVSDGVILLVTNSGAQDGKASFVSMDETQLVINWSDAPSAARIIEVWLFAGAEGYVGTAAVNATQNASTTVTPGFQIEDDTLLFVFGNGRGIPNTSGNTDAIYSLGVGYHNGSSIVQATASQLQDDAQATSVSAGRMTASYISGIPGTGGGWIWAQELTNITSTTFDLTTREGAVGTAADVFVAAVKFDAAQTYVGTLSTPTSTGDQAYSGFGFRPGWVGLFSTMFAALDTSYTDGSAGAIGVGAGDSGGSEASMAWASEDNAATSNTQSIADGKLLNTPQHDGSTGFVATLTSLDSDGFTADFSTTIGAGAKLAIVFAVEGSDPSVALATTEESFGQDGGQLLVTNVMATTEESLSEDGGQLSTSIDVLSFATVEESLSEDGGQLVLSDLGLGLGGKPTKTYPEPQGLTVSVYEPLTQGEQFLFDISDQLSSLSFETAALGGYWSGSIKVADRQGRLEEWYERGLQRRIVITGPEGQVVWEGFVNRITLNLGGLTKTVGPVLDIYNRVRLVYSFIATGLANPELGIRASTDWADDLDSQARWGILSRVLSSGGATPEDADSLRDDYLRENAKPETDENQNIGGNLSEPTMDIELLGYVHNLQSYIFNSTATGATTATEQLQAILDAEPNDFITHAWGFLTTNDLAVSAYDNDDRIAWNAIKEIVAKGDALDNRYLFGVYADRTPVYGPVVDQIDYFQALSDPAQMITTRSGQRVAPWDIKPGRWLFTSDFMVGRVPETTQLREDPRAEFIESVTFQSPWTVSMRGSKVRRLDQKLAKLGLAGIGG